MNICLSPIIPCRVKGMKWTVSERARVSQALFSKWMSCESNQMGLTAPDFFLWGFWKEKVFATNSQTLAELKDKITEEIGRIDAATLETAMEGVLSRARSCVAHNGCHLTDVVFHAWKCKTSVNSLSFEVSFVLIGAIERSHDKNKSASRLLGHPVQLHNDKIDLWNGVSRPVSSVNPFIMRVSIILIPRYDVNCIWKVITVSSDWDYNRINL